MTVSPHRNIVRVLILAVRRFDQKNGWIMSSHVAMSMLLALFPFLLFVVALAGTVTKGVEVEELIELTIGSWPEEIAAPIAREMYAVLNNSGSGLLTLGGALALYFASNGVDALRAAMTRAYHGDDRRPFWRQRLLALGFVLAGAVILVAAAFLWLALPLYLRFVSDAAPGLYQALFSSNESRRVFTVVLLILGVLACHLWLPGNRSATAPIWPGIVLTVLCWGAAGYGFAFYLDRFASYSATYAGLAGAMSALIFLYMMSAILILGAEVNGVLGDVDRIQGADPE